MQWCKHCEQIAPEYELVARTFSLSDHGVVVARVDGDAYGDVAARYDIMGYPSFLFFPAHPTHKSGILEYEEYRGGRRAEDFAVFLNSRLGIAQSVLRAPSPVRVLSASEFDSVALAPDTAAFVMFFAPWCGHSKRLKPAWEELARTFAGEDSVVIAAIDADAEHELAVHYGITAFPTLLFFPAVHSSTLGNDPILYEGQRSAAEFIAFVNENTGAKRTIGGGLDAAAGRFTDLDRIASAFIREQHQQSKIAEAEAIVAALPDDEATQAQYYVKTMQRVLDRGIDYITKERSRLQSLSTSRNVPARQMTSIMLRLNVLQAFVTASENDTGGDSGEL